MNFKELQANDLFKGFIKQLLENGFQVYVSDSQKGDKTFCQIVKDNKIGSVHTDRFGGLNFATVNKPCKNYGTGSSVAREVFEPTLELAEQTFNYFAWHITGKVVKYKDWNDFQSSGLNKILNYIEIKL